LPLALTLLSPFLSDALEATCLPDDTLLEIGSAKRILAIRKYKTVHTANFVWKVLDVMCLHEYF